MEIEFVFSEVKWKMIYIWNDFLNRATYICAVFLHWMSHLVTLVSSSFTSKEAILAHIKVEAFETAIPKKKGHQSSWWNEEQAVANLNPNIGFCLHMLHLAWCFAVSAAVNLQYKCLERRRGPEYREWMYEIFFIWIVYSLWLSACV